MDGEDPEERLGRNLTELLGEVRVAMPGVQVLFAFLLAVPFQQRFLAVTTDEERVLYAAALASAAFSTACFVAPTAFHRVAFRRGQRARLVTFANRCVLAGLATLAISISASTTLVAAVLVDGTLVPGLTAGVCLAVFAVMWLGVGLVARRAPVPPGEGIDRGPGPGTP